MYITTSFDRSHYQVTVIERKIEYNISMKTMYRIYNIIIENNQYSMSHDIDILIHIYKLYEIEFYHVF